MKKKQKREKRKLIKKGKNGEPTVIDFNLSKAVIVAIIVGVIIVTITTVRIITTLIGAREESSLSGEGSSETETNVTWVVSTSIDDEGNVVEDTDENGKKIKIPVPAGYSASKIPGETSANSGFVIYEGEIDWSTILVDEDGESEDETEKDGKGEIAEGGTSGTESTEYETATLLDDINANEETIESTETENGKDVLLIRSETYDEGDEESEPETFSEDDEDDEEETTVTQQEQNIYDLQRTTNQWVWVPVSEENISRIYGVDSNGKLWGKLYDYSSSGRSALNWTLDDNSSSLITISSTTEYREPDVTHYNTDYDIDSSLQSYLDGTAQYGLLFKELEENFYLMIKSIQEYGGFYIGRYETGGLSGTAVVQKMNTDINSQTWYTMYEKCKELSGENENVITSMIWGCLWDETLQWFIDSEAQTSEGETITYSLIYNYSTHFGNYPTTTFNYIKSTSKIPESTETKASGSETVIPTGSADYTKVNNIYDMAGNVYDWTLETDSTNGRVYRGGSSSSTGSTRVSSRSANYVPTNSNIYRRL